MSVLDTGAEYVNAGSRMVWTGQFGNYLTSWAGLSGSYDAMISGVTADLRNQFHLVVEKVQDNLTLILANGSITLYLRTEIDRGDGFQDDGLTDIMGNVYDTFKAHGYTPLTDSINQYQAASGDADIPAPPPIVIKTALPTVQTQKTQDAASQPGGTDASSTGIGWLDSALGKAEAGTLGLAIGALAVIGLFAYLALRPQAA